MSRELPVAVVVHLSGNRRGTTERLAGERFTVGSDEEADIRLSGGASKTVADRHATLVRRGGTYEILVAPGRGVWVNGEPVRRQTLVSGDVLEVGRDGPVVRFRLYPPGSKAWKSMREAFDDCVDCAWYDEGSALRKVGVLLAGVPRELTTQVSWKARGAMAAVLAILLAGGVWLVDRNQALENRLAVESSRIVGLEDLLEETERHFITVAELDSARAEMSALIDSVGERVERAREGLVVAGERIQGIEEEDGALGRVIGRAARSVVFLQGSYGFVDSTSGQPLRYLGMESNGGPLRMPGGPVGVSTEGSGPIVQVNFTGTAFVAGEKRYLVTNRHVAEPWTAEERALAIIANGYRPVMLRFVAYAPGIDEPLGIERAGLSGVADLAILEAPGGALEGVPSLPLRTNPPGWGEEIVVLGYPTGLKAMMVRADDAFVDALRDQGGEDFWESGRRLAEGGWISPLATRGIVAQVSRQAIVYDASTTRGGSGGPVLDEKGRVVAVVHAVLSGFDGSNIGVPAGRVAELLTEVGER